MLGPLQPLVDMVTSPLFLMIVLFPGLTSIAIIGALLGWLERKVTARVQLRIGPLYASPAGGILQMFADLIKLSFKELIVPENSDAFFFLMAPTTGLVLRAALVVLMPLAPRLRSSDIVVRLPAILDIITMSS